MKRLKNKVAIITGGASGMGALEAKIFTQEGAKVLITDVNKEKLKSVTEEIRNAGGAIDYIVQDVTSEPDWLKVAEKVISLYAKVDILVNNAGLLGDVSSPIEKRTLEEFNKIMAVNVTGQFLGIKSLVPYLKKNGGGSIINISSIAGISGATGVTAYTASKGASRILTKGGAVEFAKDNIRVNSVHPGYVETPMVENMKGADDFGKMAVSNTPIGRAAQPMDIVMGVVYLASDEASYMTGSELVIDGGFTAM